MCAEAVTGTLYLDDVKVGDVFRSREHALDAAQIIAFASSFDPQRFHLSDEAARDSLFKGLAASGWHTASITMRLLVESLPLADGVIGAGVELSWPRPTRPGDILRAESTVTEIRPSRSKPDQAIATLETLTMNQNGEVLQRMVSKNVLFRRRG
ncbi:MAG: MaoC family dehydratase [Proteobacteria bacterium]|nr:MaoC family dehydratase [Pseudomonadota bacterium]